MSELQVRRIPFAFDGVEFIWNPENPAFSTMMNAVSYTAIGLEKYFCRAMTDADAQITDESVREEAKLFKLQEAIHSRAHQIHVDALAARYPALKGLEEEITASYEALYRERDLKFHLAYAGGLEATFTPLFRGFIDNRDVLFRGGDARIASLFLWHFCEEMEHRNSAISIYNHVVGDRLFRLRQTPVWRRHAAECFKIVMGAFKQRLPELPPEAFGDPLGAMGRGHKLRTLLWVIESQMPWHQPLKARVPDYYGDWRARYEQGEDMRFAYGVRTSHEAA